MMAFHPPRCFPFSRLACLLDQAQHLESSKPREMYCPMPVITCVAVVNARADNSTFM